MLHVFYNPRDLDSCLAAWATRHGLGEKAVELHSGEIEYHSDMLLLNRTQDLEHHGEPANVLSLHHVPLKSTMEAVTVRGDVVLSEKRSPISCCFLAWGRFHASGAPWLIRAYDDRVYGSEKPDVTHAYNAMLSVPWTMAKLDEMITAFETPRTRANLLLDGQVILAYRKLRGDLCPL